MFDASSASDALRHTVAAGMAAWISAALLFIARAPHGKLARHLVLWRVLLVACVLATAVSTIVSIQYLHMCSETTQLLHVIPLWLRDVEVGTKATPLLRRHANKALSLRALRVCLLSRVAAQAVIPECKTALASTQMWLWNTPPHLHLQLPVLSKVAVPATRDVPIAVLVFFSSITAFAVLGLSVRYQLNKYQVKQSKRRSKKSD